MVIPPVTSRVSGPKMPLHSHTQWQAAEYMRVLIAIDNKPSSQAILDAVVKMHWSEGSQLHVVTVRLAAGSNEAAEQESTAVVEEIAYELHKYMQNCEVFFLAPQGDPKAEILKMAANVDADLIVIGSNCKNTLERILTGSVCQAVLNGAETPVLVAKAPCCLARESAPGFKNILIPIDSSVYSDVAISWMGNFSWSEDCRFIVCAAVEGDTNMKVVERSLKKRALTLSKLLRTKNIFTDIGTGEPKEAILELAKKYYSDLIVIGSHGRSGLRKLLLGSVAQSISQEAPCAVAVIKGIAPEDKSWKTTGVFEKMEPVSIKDLVQSGDGRRDDNSPGVMPAGMG